MSTHARAYRGEGGGKPPLATDQFLKKIERGGGIRARITPI